MDGLQPSTICGDDDDDKFTESVALRECTERSE